MKKILLLFIYFLFSCDVEIPIRDNFVVEAFLFQGEEVDDINPKENMTHGIIKDNYYIFSIYWT